jgi:hypothetical protein
MSRFTERSRTGGFDAMKKTTSREKKPGSPPKARGESAPSAAGRRKRSTLGYAQDAGHPGGLQDLRAKTDTEAEHDVWERHG